MITASKLGGFFAAHAIWCVSDGATLIPMLAYTTADGARKMERIVSDDLRAAVSEAKSRLEANGMDADDGALLYDGRITVSGEKLDAILVELRAYFSPGSTVVLAVPYTPHDAPGGFRVHRPKLLDWTRCDDFDPDRALEAFFEGVASHEQGSRIWNDCLDESK